MLLQETSVLSPCHNGVPMANDNAIFHPHWWKISDNSCTFPSLTLNATLTLSAALTLSSSSRWNESSPWTVACIEDNTNATFDPTRPERTGLHRPKLCHWQNEISAGKYVRPVSIQQTEAQHELPSVIENTSSHITHKTTRLPLTTTLSKLRTFSLVISRPVPSVKYDHVGNFDRKTRCIKWKR